MEGGCVLWGMSVVQVELQELYCDHPVICKMKSIACSYIWWPALDGNIKTLLPLAIKRS